MAKIEYFCAGTVLDYQDRKNKNKVGTVFQINIEIDKHQIRTVYYVTDDRDDTVLIDGESFKQL